MTLRRHLPMFLLSVFVNLILFGGDQDDGKRVLSLEDFDTWNSISGQILSREGSWLAYYLKPQLGDGTLIIAETAGNTEYRIDRGSGPVFGYNDRTVIYTVLPPEDAYGNPEKDVKNRLGIFDLISRDTVIYDQMKRYTVSENARWLGILVDDTTSATAEPDSTGPENGKKDEKKTTTAFYLRDLANGGEIRIDHVDEFSFDEHESYIVYTVLSEDAPVNGIYARNLKSGTVNAIMAGIGTYKAITWDEPQKRIAFVADGDTTDTANRPWKLYSWEAGKATARLLLDPETTEGFPGDMKIANEPGLLWSKHSNSLFFNIQRKIEEPEDTTVSAEEIPDVHIWHWRDVLIHPQREKRKSELENKSYRALFNLQRNVLVRLSDETMETLNLSPDHTRAFGMDRRRYEDEQPWNPEFHDVYLVNLNDGTRKLIRERQRFGLRWSNGSNYLYWFDDADWYAYELRSGTTHRLSGLIPTELRNLVFDRAGVPGAWGSPGWVKDDRGVLLYDRYDIWLVTPDGSTARNITADANPEGNVRFRYVRIDPDEEYIDLDNEVFLSYFHDGTKASGYYRLNHRENRLDSLLVIQKAVGAPVRTEAENAYLFTIETFDEFPDLYMSDTAFGNIRRLTDANPQQIDFAWGSARLFEWHNADGIPLQGILYLPADYKRGQRYPLIVYIYERLADLLHRYGTPRASSRINPAFYTSNGYAVIDADVVYTIGQPGQSAVKSVVPAALKLVEMGIADPERIGLQGHSWGGYQTAYVVTQTDLFSAAVAGAPVSNMVSAYGGIRWGTGNPRTYQYEIGQSRIGRSLWERPDLYLENSPVFYADRIRTPLLVMHGDDDGAVPWYQSIELYLAMRRLGKEMFFLHYADAPHNLMKRKNRIDYNRRIFEFFEHYLNDKQAPDWISTRASDR
jgi:dipeptidyl aminopeptidase/acylaminoacyl peptidase